MIVRKPYAFLIKYFKFIHFIVLLLSLFIFYKTSVIYNFFNDYVRVRQVINDNILNSYNVALLFILSIMIIMLSVVIYILLKQKDKPRTLYVYIVLYYFIYSILLLTINPIISNIIIKGISPKISRIYRDISLINLIIQVVFIIFILIRTIGFDVKKFRFWEDLEEFEIDITDDEEIELRTGIDRDKVAVKVAKAKENWKYFYLENKLIILIISVVIFVIIPSTFIARNIYMNKRYNEDEKVIVGDTGLVISNTYITKYDYKGNQILKGNNSFLIIRFNVENISNHDTIFAIDNLKVESNKKVYIPNKIYYDSFYDFGKGYYREKINPSNKNDYIAIYIIDDDDINDSMVVRYTDKISSINTLYKRINIFPIVLNNFEIIDDVNIGDKMLFNESLLNNTSLLIKDYSIDDNYSYIYKNNKKYIISDKGLVLKLSYNFELDNNITYIKRFSDLLQRNAYIEYIVDGVTYINEIVNITPSAYSDSDIFLEVNNNIELSSSIKLIFKIRNIKYTYVIK